MNSAIPAASGIYRITCTSTGKFYIGSATNLRRRYSDHFTALRRNTHTNQKLQRAFNKYSEDAFTFEVLELVLLISLTAREQYWFNKLKPFDKHGFNIAREANSTLGVIKSAETCEKIRIGNLGKKHSDESKIKMSLASKGKPKSAATKVRMGNARRGKPSPLRGVKKDRKIVEKSRLARIGYVFSEEERATQRVSHEFQMKTIIVTAPDGTEYTVHGVKQFCQEHHLDCSSLMRAAKGTAKGKAYTQHKGYKARFPEISQ